MDPLNDVALLQIAVLQQDLLERDVEETRKRKRRKKPRRYQTRPWLTEKRRRLYGHYAKLMEDLRVEDPGGSRWYQLPTLKVQGHLQQRELAFQELLGQQHLGQWWTLEDVVISIRQILSAD